MDRQWSFASGVAVVSLALALVASVIGVRETRRPKTFDPPATLAPATEPALVSVDEDAVEAPAPVRLVPAEPDPAHDILPDLADALVYEHLQADDTSRLLAHWRTSATSESRLLFVAPNGRRVITLSSARVPCDDVDEALEHVRNALVGEPGLCERWKAEAVQALEESGVTGAQARRFLREQSVDTSVRVLLVYAGWRRTGKGLEDWMLVSEHTAEVYPQSDFGVARRVALDAVMRRLGVGPYTDTPIEIVTALLRW